MVERPLIGDFSLEHSNPHRKELYQPPKILFE